MKIIKKIQTAIQNMSIPGAMLMSGLIVGLSIFLTTWVFFGGFNNRQKLFTPNPAKKATQTNALTQQQIQQIQQQRAAMTPPPTAPAPASTTTVAKPATTAPKAPVKK
jgi:amino acid transporter